MKRRWRHLLIGLTAAWMIANPVQAADRSSVTLVVSGKLDNQTYEHVSDPDDFLGHGWITATLYVKRVLKGKAPKRVLRVRYFAHTYFREDMRHRFRLIPAGDVDYLICAEPGNSGVKCN